MYFKIYIEPHSCILIFSYFTKEEACIYVCFPIHNLLIYVLKHVFLPILNGKNPEKVTLVAEILDGRRRA